MSADVRCSELGDAYREHIKHDLKDVQNHETPNNERDQFRSLVVSKSMSHTRNIGYLYNCERISASNAVDRLSGLTVL